MRVERVSHVGIVVAVFLGGVALGYAWRGSHRQLPPNSAVAGTEAGSDLPRPVTSPESGLQPGRVKGDGLAVSNQIPADEFLGRMAKVMMIGADFRRQREFFRLLDEMTPENAIAVRNLLARTLDQGVLYENLWEAFWTRWGEIDGAGAMDYITQTQKHDSIPKDIRRVMRGWGAEHPEAAAAWAEANQGHYLRDGLVGLTDGYASVNLPGATALVLQAAPPGDANLGPLMETLAEQAMRQGRAVGLKAWFDQLPQGADDGARARALGHVYWRLQSADVDQAKDWVREQSSKPWRSDKIVGQMAGKIAEKDPAAAAEWLQSVPPSPQNGAYSGIEVVMQRWTNVDRAAAQTWINGLTDGPFKAQALAAFSKPPINKESAVIWTVAPAQK